jgi:hypothetical protein
MSKAVAEYNNLVSNFDAVEGITVGQMFGKACIKINGKAFVSQHNETVVFKLNGEYHQKALAVKGAVLWDPSGKGRPMKEWIALPATAHKHFAPLANAALAYVAATA